MLKVAMQAYRCPQTRIHIWAGDEGGIILLFVGSRGFTKGKKLIDDKIEEESMERFEIGRMKATRWGENYL
jgi:hypothetical protein